ncbi:MAG: hypothetical protein WBC44_00895 [Planctomycetaceae bacterium]
MIKTCFAMAFGLLTATFLGCGETSRPVADGSTASDEAAGDDAKVALSEAEIQSLAEEQKVCAVTGEPLGSMGSPVPVRVTDLKGAKHTVLHCCESCREELLENPDEHLAKLGR